MKGRVTAPIIMRRFMTMGRGRGDTGSVGLNIEPSRVVAQNGGCSTQEVKHGGKLVEGVTAGDFGHVGAQAAEDTAQLATLTTVCGDDHPTSVRRVTGTGDMSGVDQSVDEPGHGTRLHAESTRQLSGGQRPFPKDDPERPVVDGRETETLSYGIVKQHNSRTELLSQFGDTSRFLLHCCILPNPPDSGSYRWVSV